MDRILIIKLGALGDVVMATPLVDAILTRHADAAVTLLTTPDYAPLFAPWPRLAVHTSARRGLRTMLALLRWLRAQRFDRVYDLQGNDRSALLCRLSAIPVRVGNHAGRGYTHHPAHAWEGQCHIFERMCEVLATAGVTVTARTPLLPASAAVRDTVDQWLAARAPDARPFALLHAGASAARPEKRWPYFATLARTLREAGYRVVWLGSAEDAWLNHGYMAADDIDASAAFDILALAELGRRAAFAVTNDSGPMHVLAAAGIPVFGIFGPSDWRRNHALGQAAHVIAGVELLPAYAGMRSADCLREVGVAMVSERLGAAGLLDEAAARPSTARP
ncbi:MAG: glycosyltransferase family 9 protein [Gammaproteobacteria bacterium]